MIQQWIDRLTDLDTWRDPATYWLLFGFAAQACFFARFFIQWLLSERRGKSYIPIAFWYFSLAGGVMLFVYAVYRWDPVFMAGQGAGVFIYVRNLVLIYRRRWRYKQRRQTAGATTPTAEKPVAAENEGSS